MRKLDSPGVLAVMRKLDSPGVLAVILLSLVSVNGQGEENIRSGTVTIVCLFCQHFVLLYRFSHVWLLSLGHYLVQFY